MPKSSPGWSYPIGRAAQTREITGNHVVEAWLFSCSVRFDIYLFQLEKVAGQFELFFNKVVETYLTSLKEVDFTRGC